MVNFLKITSNRTGESKDIIFITVRIPFKIKYAS